MTGTDWGEFAAAQPALAGQARRLFLNGGDIATAYLATVSRRGRPRLHPVFPVFTAADLWLFIVEMSPKYRDLQHNGFIALHALPPAGGGEEFALQGHAEHVADATTRAAVVQATGGRQGAHEFEHLFRCTLTTALHTRWDGWGTANAWPSYAKWHAAAAHR